MQDDDFDLGDMLWPRGDTLWPRRHTILSKNKLC